MKYELAEITGPCHHCVTMLSLNVSGVPGLGKSYRSDSGPASGGFGRRELRLLVRAPSPMLGRSPTAGATGSGGDGRRAPIV